MYTKNRSIAAALLLAFWAGGYTSTSMAQAADAEVVEEVVVTGSRIVRPNLVQPTPVTSITSEELRVAGTSDLGGFLAQLPALGQTGTILANADQFEVNADGGGLSLLDLRRLGTARTLVLVDGKRHVSSFAGSTSVDVNTIPIGLVERVEVVTGGASAVYGSDAVSGVVNMILKDNYEGVEVDLRTGESTEGSYAGEDQFSLLAGMNFADDRGNITFSYQRTELDGIRETDLPYADDVSSIVNPLDTGPNDGIPDRLIVPRVYSEYADENGVLFTAVPIDGVTSDISDLGFAVVAFDENGNPRPQTLRDGTNNLFFGSFPDGCEYCLKLGDYSDVIPPIESDAFNLRTRFQFADWGAVYMDAKYVEYETTQDGQQPSFNTNIVFDAATNPFIDPALAQSIVDNGAGLDGAGLVLMFDFFDDFGGRTSVVDRETTRIVVGMEGTFETGMGAIDYDVYYNYGETEIVVEGANLGIDDNIANALLSVAGADGAECLIPDGGVTDTPCVPLNPFGRQNSRAAWNYSFTGYERKQKLEQENAGFTLVSDTSSWFSLPGGGIGWAAGFEWRDEESSNALDEIVKSGITEFAPQPDEVGGYDVTEYFFEVTLPLLADQPFARELTLDGAFRKADYSHAGDATAWKTGLIWAPFDDFRIRGTYSEAVRAPNITEAFLPQTPGFQNIDDPCDAAQLSDDPDRAANCAALGAPDGFIASDAISIDTISGGNRNLESEESESFTYGFIYEPRWFEGLAITVDYYDIEIEDAITFVESQDILDNCVDASGGPDGTFCGLITRGADFNVELVRSTAVNAAALETEGIDYQVTFNKQLSDWTDGTGMSWLNGYFTISVVGNYLKQLNEFVFQDRPDEIDIERGELGDPVQQGRLSAAYQHENWRVGWVARYVGNMKRYDRTSDTCEDISPCETGDVTYHDLNFTYMFDTSDMQFEVYGGVNNVADEEPPQNFSPNTANSAIFSIGRTWFVGLRGRL